MSAGEPFVQSGVVGGHVPHVTLLNEPVAASFHNRGAEFLSG
jgi:hypothetical protein